MGITVPDLNRRGFLDAIGKVTLAGGAALLLKPKGADPAMPWPGYTQAERNRLILNRAGQDLGRRVYRNCKEWAYDVVASASGGVVYLPTTTSGGLGYTWNYSSDVAGYDTCKPLEQAQEGEIVQMNWKLSYISPVTGQYWTPHTAIVFGKDSSGVMFIESSWYENGVVSTPPRYVSFNTFYSKTFIDYVYKYAIYRIL